MEFRFAVLAVAAALLGRGTAHTVITYPGWRGNSLHTNGTLPQNNPDTIGVDWNNETQQYDFPYGMQWIYPCEQCCTNRTVYETDHEQAAAYL